MTGFEIAPLKGLRFDTATAGTGGAATAEALVAPPYDIIDATQHRELLERSPHNIVRLTLGELPGEQEDYRARGRRLLDWKRDGVLREDGAPAFYAYGCEYTVPGTADRARFLGLAALGRLHPFEAQVVLPHERTFARVVDDRLRILEATATQLEMVFLLYEDPARAIEALLGECACAQPAVSVEARPGERHSIWRIQDAQVTARLVEFFRGVRPIIADGHHRYTTGLLFRERNPDLPGSSWQPMVLGNLVGDGLSILATHRLVDTGGRAAEAVRRLGEQLERVPADSEAWDYSVETAGTAPARFRIPQAVRRSRSGVAATDYGLLHDVVLGQWLRPLAPNGEFEITYFKEGSGEDHALERGDGDLLFRMRPIPASQFRTVVEAGEVFPHKTTFFYPKLWSGLLMWSLAEPGSAS